MSLMSRLAGAGGFEIIRNTTEVTGKNYDVIVPLADTVFDIMSGVKGDSEGSDKDFFLDSNMTGQSFPAGSVIPVPNGSIITNLKLVSGSVIAYLKNEV
jgi:hypothetical protein